MRSSCCYCAPAAIAAYVIVARQLRRRLRGQRVDLDEMDVLDVQRRGRAISAGGAAWRGADAGRSSSRRTLPVRRGASAVIERIRGGPNARPRARRPGRSDRDASRCSSATTSSEELADGLDRHYVFDAAGKYEAAFQAEQAVDEVLASMARRRRRAQLIGGLALIPFVALLVVHGIFHDVPLFLASFAGFLAALPAIARSAEDARAGAARGAAWSTPSTTFCFRCSCRSRCSRAPDSSKACSC